MSRASSGEEDDGSTSTARGRTRVAVSPHDPLGRRQFGQTHGSSGVQLLGGDADLGAETELLPVGERGRRVHHDRRGVHPFGEPARSGQICGDDGLAVCLLVKFINHMLGF